MHIFPIILLAVIQGITEFLPISSSAHLLIAAEMMHIGDTFSLDISLHLGTLMAVLIYFRIEALNFFKFMLSPFLTNLIFKTKLNQSLIIASRAGVVYTGSRIIGLNRVDAARFAMLLSIPVIMISASIPIIEIAKNSVAINYINLLIGFLIAFITAYLSIRILLSWVKNNSMIPFVIYRIIIGSIILIYFT